MRHDAGCLADRVLVGANVRCGWKADIASWGHSSHHPLMRKAICICVALLAATACSKREPPKVCVPVLPGWSSEQTGKPVSTIANRVTLSGHEILWNGYPTDEQTFNDLVRQMSVLDPVPLMSFDPGIAPDCSYARHIRDTLDQNLPCREGQCWQGSKAAYDRAPYRKHTGAGVP